jgi:hypothetical protein
MSIRSRREAPKCTPIGGRLDLSGQSLTSLSDIPVHLELEELDVSDNELDSFATLKLQPNLKKIIASNNPITNLNGLPDQPALRELVLRNTTISKEKQYRQRTLATVGDNLLKLDGVALTADDQKIAHLIHKRKPEKCFLTPELTDAESIHQFEVNDEIHTLYCHEHRRFFGAIALNEAILFDLQENGPMPLIDENSSEKELARAIRKVRERLEVLRRKIEELGARDE